MPDELIAIPIEEYERLKEIERAMIQMYEYKVNEALSRIATQNSETTVQHMTQLSKQHL